jgi:hypothetical protein
VTDLVESRERNRKATVACVLGSLAFACLLSVAVGAAFDQGWIMEPDTGAWLLLPFIALTCGGTAAFIGIAAWVDARESGSGNGLRQAQAGAILGGIAAGAVILTLVVLFVMFIFFVFAAANE